MGSARIQIFHWRVGSYENGCLFQYKVRRRYGNNYEQSTDKAGLIDTIKGKGKGKYKFLEPNE